MDAGASARTCERFALPLSRLVGAGDWPRALEVARECLALDPRNASAHLVAGQALVNLRRYAEARPHLEMAIGTDPSNGFAHRLMSIVRFRAGDFAAADSHIQRAIELQPNEAMHWLHLAWMRHENGAPEIAARHAGRAYELDPRNSDVINLLALCDRRDGRTQRKRYLQALELDPENSYALNNLGVHQLDVEKDYAAAEESFRRALLIDPTDKTFQRNLLVTLRHRDRFYQLLCSPRSLVSLLRWNQPEKGWLGRLALIALWLVAGRILFAVLLAWFVLIYPLAKVYEYLTLGDIQARAGVPGARRGGPFGFRRWPFAARFGVFVALTALFWGGLCLAARDADPAVSIRVILGASICGFVLVIGGRQFKRAKLRRAARRSEKKFNREMNPAASSPRY